MADTSFFGRLTKLFSAKAIVTVDQKGRRRVVDTDERQQTNLSSLRDRYTKLQKSFYEQAGGAQSMAYQQVRREVFRDYDAMDQDPIIASALDIYADESTLKNEFGTILSIRSDNNRVQEALENLFYDILNIEFNLWPWTRNMCKYGDFFLGMEIAEGKGIVNVTPHSVYNTERLELIDPNNPNSVKFKITEDPNGKMEYDNFEIAHFRLLSDTNWLPYGKSMIENGRRLWKQLSLMEDAMLIHRIMRAPEKRVFKIDIGNIPPQEVDNYMQRIINKMKKVPFIDKNSGEYNLKFDINCWSEWAENAQVDSRCINFLLKHPELVTTNTNSRSITTFFNSISSLDSFETTLPLIQMIGEGSVGGEFSTLFTMFINNRLDKIISPQTILTHESDDYVVSQLKSTIGKDDKYRADLASIISQRIVNYSLFYAKHNKIEKPIIDRLAMLMNEELFAVDLKYKIVKEIYNGDTDNFRSLMLNKTLLKFLTK